MKKYVKAPGGYMMVLRQGDNVLQELEQLAKRENIPSATFVGLGFVSVTFGFFDFKTKEYTPARFNDVELTGMIGSIAWKDGRPSIHAHGTVGTSAFETHAGHILEALVSTGSVEIRIEVMDQKLERKEDPKLGADVLTLKEL